MVEKVFRYRFSRFDTIPECDSHPASHPATFPWLLRSTLGNAIPDRFANPGISGLSLLNPGIPGLIPGLNRARLWLAIAGLVIDKIATTRTTHIVYI